MQMGQVDNEILLGHFILDLPRTFPKLQFPCVDLSDTNMLTGMLGEGEVFYTYYPYHGTCMQQTTQSVAA